MDAEYYTELIKTVEAEIRRIEKTIANATDIASHLIDFNETLKEKRELAEQGIDPETGVRMIKFPNWKNIVDPS